MRRNGYYVTSEAKLSDFDTAVKHKFCAGRWEDKSGQIFSWSLCNMEFVAIKI